MQNKIRVGVVGANCARGWARDAHVPALQSFADAEIVAVSARTKTIADEAASSFGAKYSFSDSIALAQSDEVDLVVVTVKVPEHRAIVLAAIEAGKHVYCEWPLGSTLEQTKEMAAAARARGIHAAIGLQGTVSPAVLTAVQLVKRGELGDLQCLRVFSPTAGWGAVVPEHYGYLSDREHGATLLSIAGGHTLAVMQALVGPYLNLESRATTFHPHFKIAGSERVQQRSCADHIVVSGQHGSGCVSILEVAGGQLPTAEFSCELIGTQGKLSLTSNFPGGFQGGDITLRVNGAECVEPVALKGPPANVASVYARLFSDIRAGSYTAPSFDDAVHLAHLLEAIEVSSAQGRRQSL